MAGIISGSELSVPDTTHLTTESKGNKHKQHYTGTMVMCYPIRIAADRPTVAVLHVS